MKDYWRYNRDPIWRLLRRDDLTSDVYGLLSETPLQTNMNRVLAKV